MMDLCAADVGVALGIYANPKDGRPVDPDRIRELVDQLLAVPATTPADALAHVVWLAALLPIAAAAIPADEDGHGGPRALVEAAAQLAQRAQTALVTTTGIPPEAFTGSPNQTN